MKKHLLLSLIIIAASVCIPLVVYANGLTWSFGGKILATEVPDVTCYGSGTGPVVLLSNLTSIGSAARSTSTTAVRSIYGVLPFYTQINTSPTPRAGQWILGRANIIPDFNNCAINVGQYRIPFPVRDTDNYRTSGRF